MNNFKLNIKEIIIILLLSAPIGSFLYINNYEKINYIGISRVGNVVTQNFCENYAYEKFNILKDSDIDLIYQKYFIREEKLNSFKNKVKISIHNDHEIYEIVLKGQVGEENFLEGEVKKILSDIESIENLKFNQNYKYSSLHCKIKSYEIFKYNPMQRVDIKYPSKKVYKKSYLIFLTILPSIIFYLIFILIKYVRKNINLNLLK